MEDQEGHPPVPVPEPGETMDAYVQRCYVTDEAGNILCLRCGCIVGSGWQLQHFRALHGFGGAL